MLQLAGGRWTRLRLGTATSNPFPAQAHTGAMHEAISHSSPLVGQTGRSLRDLVWPLNYSLDGYSGLRVAHHLVYKHWPLGNRVKCHAKCGV